MRKYFRFPQYLTIIIVIIIFILIFTFKTPTNMLNNNEIKNEQKTDQNGRTDFIIKSDTILRFETHYLGCGHLELVETPLPENIWGTNINELIHYYPEWNVKDFSDQHINLYKYEDGLCPNHYYLGIKDGYVTVFNEKPDINESIKEITDIKVQLLREDDRILLEKGIEVYGEDELMKYKEGLSN